MTAGLFIWTVLLGPRRGQAQVRLHPLRDAANNGPFNDETNHFPLFYGATTALQKVSSHSVGDHCIILEVRSARCHPSHQRHRSISYFVIGKFDPTLVSSLGNDRISNMNARELLFSQHYDALTFVKRVVASLAHIRLQGDKIPLQHRSPRHRRLCP